MKNRVTKRMFRNMVSTTVAAAILGVSLCACGAGPADAAKEEAAPANAAEAESGQEAAPADPAGPRVFFSRRGGRRIPSRACPAGLTDSSDGLT